MRPDRHSIRLIRHDEFTVAWSAIDRLIPHSDDTSRQRERMSADLMTGIIFGSDAEIRHLPSGRPILYKESSTIPISISHGSGVIAIAWRHDRNGIGIDIEAPREQLLRIYPRFLRPEEYPAEITVETLLPLWTRKEAAWKAIFPQPPSLLDVPIDTTDTHGNTPAAPGSLTFHTYHIPPNLLLTIALP